MKIAESSVAMSSVRQYTEKYEESETLRILVGNNSTPPKKDTIDISDRAKCRRCEQALKSDIMGVRSRYRHMLKALLVEALSGRKMNLLDPRSVEPAEAEKAANEEASSSGEIQGSSGVGVIYDHTTRYEETERISLEASGSIRTADNREISFSLNLEMSRTFVETTGVHIRAGDPALTDPLVVNYAGTASELSETRFEFDLDVDGNADLMPGLKGGSGFLALDHNKDGKVNSGAELFGPSTGDGFGELAAYDEDANQWIDENDSIFDKLRIWIVNGKGMGALEPLRHRNIGAIHLGKLATLFDHRDSANQVEAQTTNTGLFLREDGTAGTIQQLELVV